MSLTPNVYNKDDIDILTQFFPKDIVQFIIIPYLQPQYTFLEQICEERKHNPFRLCCPNSSHHLSHHYSYYISDVDLSYDNKNLDYFSVIRYRFFNWGLSSLVHETPFVRSWFEPNTTDLKLIKDKKIIRLKSKN